MLHNASTFVSWYLCSVAVHFSVSHCLYSASECLQWIYVLQCNGVTQCIYFVSAVTCSVLQRFIVSLQWLLTWSFLCPAGSAPGCRHWGTLCSGTVPPGGGSNRQHNIRKQRIGSHDLSVSTALRKSKGRSHQINKSPEGKWQECALPTPSICVSGAILWTTCKLYRLLHCSDQTLSAQMQSLIKSLAFPDHIKLPLLQVYIPRR